MSARQIGAPTGPAFILEAWFVLPAALLFYFLTLAPTALWSDSGYLQRAAALGLLDRDGSGRALWFVAARLIVGLPVGDPAFRVNALSALAGAVAVVLVHQAGLAAGLSRRAAVVAAAAFAVSHTFWQQATRAEVYTPFMALLALQIWLWFKWQPGRIAPVAATVGLWGVMLLAHQMAVLIAPALLLLCLCRRGWLRTTQWLLVALVGIASFGLALLVLQWQTQAPPATALLIYLTHAGIDFRPAIFGFSWSALPKDLLLSAAYALLQFPSPALLLGLLSLPSIARRVRRDAGWAALLVLALTDFAFAFDYHVNDNYVFFLPMYLVLALVIGSGWDEAERRWQAFRRAKSFGIALVLIILTPVAAYASATTIVQQLGVNPLHIRVLPGRDPARYFLWPALNGYDDAAVYARTSLASVPPDAVILADYTPYAVLSYVELVEKRGAPGVQVIRTEPWDDLGALIRSLPSSTQVYLADNNPRYYNLASLSSPRLERVGPVYHLQR